MSRRGGARRRKRRFFPLSSEVVRVTQSVFRADPAGCAAKAEVAKALVVTDDAGNTLFTIYRQRESLRPLW